MYTTQFLSLRNFIFSDLIYILTAVGNTQSSKYCNTLPFSFREEKS